MNTKIGLLIFTFFFLNLSFISVIDAQKVTKPDPIAPPELVSPAAGTQINIFPRKITFEWKQVIGALKYEIEVGYNDGNWQLQKQAVTNETSYTLDFIGKNPGRWRVRSYSTSSGKAGVFSEWRSFTCLR